MAIYHLSGQVISRSQGRSSVASAAYRAAERIIDERTGLTHDFTKKANDIVEKEILLPDNAPRELANRDTLWNTVEATEKRKDAQLAREFNISLPRELSQEQNWQLAKAFVQTEFVDKGMIADVTYHRGHQGQEEQPHIHVMLTMRRVDENGFGKKAREWNDKNLLNHWREAWAKQANDKFIELGIDQRIDHRTLEAQGINLEPQTKIGPKKAAPRVHADRTAEHLEKARENGERVIDNPVLILTALTARQSTFTQRDIARMVHRYTADKDQFDQAYPKVLASKELVLLGQDTEGRDRYSTREHCRMEVQLVREAVDMSNRQHHAVDDRIAESVARQANLQGDHLRAYHALLDGGDFRNLVGVAGGGKSRLLDAVREAHERQGHKVIGMTLAGKAVEGLQESSGIESRTAASTLSAWEKGYGRPDHKTVIVLDEAVMLDSRQSAKIIHEASISGAKIISMFDVEQLQAIGAGGAARAIAERVGFYELTDTQRQRVDWQKAATERFYQGDTVAGLLAYEQHDCVHAYETKAAAIDGMLLRWEEQRSEHPQQTQLMLAYENKDVQALNAAARALRQAAGELGASHSITTSKGQRAFAAGDRVYFLRNDYRDLEVRNGTLGTVEAIEGDRLRIQVDGSDRREARTVTVDVNDYPYFDHGYAATVHKSQGATVDYAQYLPSPYADRHATYSAMSRHRAGVDIHYSREQFPDFIEAARSMSRENTKDFTLDYLQIDGLEKQAEYALKREAPAHDPVTQQQRLAQAEARLAQRQLLREASPLVASMDLQLTREPLASGDVGRYRGSIEVDQVRYGVLEMGEGQAKLIPDRALASRHVGYEVDVWIGQEQSSGRLMVHGEQPAAKALEKSRSLSKGLEQDHGRGGWER